ncbi:MAG: divergent polysaccharide deacetylase family protein [Chitinispirillales bacterium]|jgi:polysaccharide deacetylase 2 family uncharacterized protein YibQ|nr:divergent polysaccharide deacetylase family protein [Chitinispirillales bacterium]
MSERKISLAIFIPAVISIAAFVIMGVLLIVRTVVSNNNVKPTSRVVREIKPSLLEEKIKIASVNFGIPEKNIKSSIDLEEKQKTIAVSLPKGKLIEEFVAQLFAAAENTEYVIVESKHVSKGKKQGKREYARIVFESKKKPHEKIVCDIIPTEEVSSESANVAFIIKGLEKLSKDRADSLLAFAEPLNYVVTPWLTMVSVDSLPNDSDGGIKKTKESRKTIDTIPSIFKKVLSPVLIEIPMEDLEVLYPKRKYTVIQSDDKKNMDKKIKTLLKMYPQAIGFYSGTGGLILNSREISEIFLQTIKKNNVVFFDARTAKNEVSREIAEELNVKYYTVTGRLGEFRKDGSKIRRTHEEWEAELKNICDKLLKNKNSAVLISADNNFVDVFVKKLPEIQKKGIQFVPIRNY